MTCTKLAAGEIHFILKDSNSLALPSRHLLFSGRTEKSRGQSRARGRKEDRRLLKESCLLSPLRVPLAWSKPAPATQAKDSQVFTLIS